MPWVCQGRLCSCALRDYEENSSRSLPDSNACEAENQSKRKGKRSLPNLYEQGKVPAVKNQARAKTHKAQGNLEGMVLDDTTHREQQKAAVNTHEVNNNLAERTEEFPAQTLTGGSKTSTTESGSERDGRSRPQRSAASDTNVTAALPGCTSGRPWLRVELLRISVEG